jgi:hypothetical protein
LNVFEHAFGRPEDRVDAPAYDDSLAFLDTATVEELQSMLDALRNGSPDTPADIEHL